MAHLFVFVLLLRLWLLVSPSVAQSCYYPDGTIAKTDTPCHSNGQVSACCGDGFACLANGVCQWTPYAQQRNAGLNGNIMFFRGSCTDDTWSSSSCPQFCIGSQYAMGGGNSMFNCTDTKYCCYGGSCTCGGNNVTVFSLGSNAITTIGVAAVATTSTSSSSSSKSSSTLTSSISVTTTDSTATSVAGNSAASSTASSSPVPAAGGLSTGAKIGLGVGIPLGIIAFALIGFLVYRTARQGRQLKTVRSQMAANTMPTQSNPMPELAGGSAYSYTSLNKNPGHGGTYQGEWQNYAKPPAHYPPHELQT